MDFPPEILHLIGGYLTRRRSREILNCCRVSKGWYKSFIPLLFHTLDIRPFDYAYGVGKLPSPDVLQRHGSLVRDITLEFFSRDRLSAGDFLPGITKLKFLSLTFCPRDWRWLRQFVADNPGIQELQVNNHEPMGNFGYLKDLAEIAPQLQDFSLIDGIVEWLTLLHFLTACHQLLKVRLKTSRVVYTRSQGKPSVEDTILSQSIRTLDFEYSRGLDFSSCLDLASRCPRLESLSFLQGESDTTFPFASGGLSNIKHCALLSRLSLVSHSLDRLQLANILDNCQRLTSLTLQTSPDLGSIAGMNRHLGSLETLDLHLCSFGVFEAILSQCPKLTNLTIALNGFIDIGQGVCDGDGRLTNTPRPWLCVGLKKLKVRSNIEKLCRLWDTLAEPLMALKELEVLVLDFFVPSGETQMSDREASELPPVASWPWKTGTFKERNLWRNSDFQWMVEAWPKLRFFEAEESDEVWPLNKGWYDSESDNDSSYDPWGDDNDEVVEEEEEEEEFKVSEMESDVESFVEEDEEDNEEEDDDFEEHPLSWM